MPTTLHSRYADLLDLGNAAAYLDEIRAIAARSPFFEGCSAAEIAALASHLHCFAAPRHYRLLQAGERGDSLLLILSGKVALYDGAAACTRQPLATGAVVGAAGIATGVPCRETCIALVPTDVAVLTRDALNLLLACMPRLGNKLLLSLLAILAGRPHEAAPAGCAA